MSRKTFYQWENKALAAMAGALEEKEPGRPEQSDKDKEIAALKERLSAIEREREEERRTAELKIEHLKLELAVERKQTEKKSRPGRPF